MGDDDRCTTLCHIIYEHFVIGKYERPMIEFVPPMILHFFTGLIPCIYKEFHKDIKQWWREGQRRHRRGAYKRIRPVVMNPHEVDPQSEDSVIEIHEPRRQLPCQDQLFDIFKEKGIVSIIEGYAVNTKTHFTLAPLYDSNSDTYFA